jgi:2,5-diamino-6-(ribosylamino)-4(3H)-pyrimidinone 5'-phosphate reductase
MVSTLSNLPPPTHPLPVRHLPTQAEPYPLPRPVVLDTDLRLSTSCKLLKNYQQRLGRRPWVVCGDVFSPEKTLRKQALEEAGAKIIQVPQGPDRACLVISPFLALRLPQGLSINNLLTTLHKLGIKSLMVEGGQRVISSFLSHRDAEAECVVDVLIVTVAATLVGAQGIGVLNQGFSSVRRRHRSSKAVSRLIFTGPSP